MSLHPIARHLMTASRTFFLNDGLHTGAKISGLHWAFYIVDKLPLHFHDNGLLSESLD